MLQSLPIAILHVAAAVMAQAQSSMAPISQLCQFGSDACLSPYTTAPMPPCWTNSTQLITATTYIFSTLTVKTLTVTTSRLVHPSTYTDSSITKSATPYSLSKSSSHHISSDAPNLASTASTTPPKTTSTSLLSSLWSPSGPVSNITITTPPHQPQMSTSSTNPSTSLIVVPLTISDPQLVSTLPTMYESTSTPTKSACGTGTSCASSSSTEYAAPTSFSTAQRAAFTTVVPVTESMSGASHLLVSGKLGLLVRLAVVGLLLLAILDIV